MFLPSKKRVVWPWVLISIIVIFIASGVVGYYYIKNLSPEKLLQSGLVQNVVKQSGREEQQLFNLLPTLLGYAKPMTYLILFENNTELRPGGGFIGSYAVVKLAQGKFNLLKMEGTEVLDKNAPTSTVIEPPQILKEHLKVKRWFFRDANWSPDFAVSAQKALDLYTAENGIAANDIGAVVAITPTVLEELLRLSGPVTVQGIEFNADNVTEKLEYEVEYGYDDKGIHFLERKQIMQPLLQAVMAKFSSWNLLQMKDYLNVGKKLVAEKQIMAYANDVQLQKQIENFGADGALKNVRGDYLLWADANLASLKTDRVMARTLNYTITREESGRYLANAQMVYQNKGKFDWRTTRYRTYARVYAPLDSELLSVDGDMKWDRTSAPGTIDQGQEMGKQWFGTFIAIEPGKIKALTFKYYLPKNIEEQINKGLYNLFVQKELGTLNNGLTLDLNFGNNIVSAKPAEAESEWGDNKYKYSTDLSVDRSFEVGF